MRSLHGSILRQRFIAGSTCGMLLALCLGCTAGRVTPARQLSNLALRRPATSSSFENEEHNAARANDGDAETAWHADDEPEGAPDWWQVDLGNATDLVACQITWPCDGVKYRYKVEGSSDRKNWALLSDQANSTCKSRVQELKLENGRQIRYVKITILGFEDGCGAGISEVKIFG